MAVLFVGMAEVSSNEITVYEGQHVKKGDQLGMFHYGGSTHALIFPAPGRPGVRPARPASGSGVEEHPGAGADRDGAQRRRELTSDDDRIRPRPMSGTRGRDGAAPDATGFRRHRPAGFSAA